MRYILIAAVGMLCAACGLLDPQQQQTALQVVDQMLAQGTITAEQAEALRQAILSGGQVAWWEQAATVVLGAGLAWLGVRSKLPVIGRGAPTQKVGLPGDLVKKTK